MTISLKTGVVKTLCKGTVSPFISQNNLTTMLKFDKIKEIPKCEECVFRMLCPILDRDTPAETISVIEVKAFSGMSIGVFPIIRESKIFIEVETKKGQVMRFDRKTGVQTNCANSRFASRILPNEIPPK